jgi:energy-converting hydrogenase Eha subunit H
MKEWIFHQLNNFNIITIIVMITFVTAMSKSNTNKQLKMQSEEFNKKIDEIKDEMRGQNTAISRLLEQLLGGRLK